MQSLETVSLNIGIKTVNDKLSYDINFSSISTNKMLFVIALK